jgi:aminoglycoside 6'-N-acetyltransferase I
MKGPLRVQALDAPCEDWLALRLALWPESPRHEHEAEMADFAADPRRYAQWLARDADGGAVGLAEAAIRSDYVNGCETSPVAFLEGLYVAPGRRGQGIARALVDEVARWGAARGCRELASDTQADNLPSQAVHRALGFAEAERTVAYVRTLAPARPADDVLLRPAAAADAAPLAVLGTQVFLDTYAPDGVRPSLAAEVLDQHAPAMVAARLADPTVQLLVAERAGHLLGYVETRRPAPPPLPAAAAGPAIEVVRLYVQPAQQRRGLGRRLLRAALEAAARHSDACAWLTAWDGNRRALAFYARLGWRDVGSVDYRFGEERYVNRVLVHALH